MVVTYKSTRRWIYYISQDYVLSSMKTSSWIATLVLSTTVFKLSCCVTLVTTSVELTMAARPKQGQGASRSTNGKKGPKPWRPLTSEMQHIVFDYGVQIKPTQF